MKKRITRIAIGAAIYVAALLLPDSPAGAQAGSIHRSLCSHRIQSGLERFAGHLKGTDAG